VVFIWVAILYHPYVWPINVTTWPSARSAFPELLHVRFGADVLSPAALSCAYIEMFVSTKYLSLMELVA